MSDNSEKRRLSVSVIIPTYNRAAFIRAAVESTLNQTRIPDEIIVVDDGSTDETDRILEQFSLPVRVIRQENRGRSAARNVGLRHATGDAVIFLDSDDLLMPTSIDRCAQTLEEHPEVGVVYSDAYYIDQEGNRIGLYSQIFPGCRPSGMVLGELARRSFLTVTSMVRRTSLKDITFEEGSEYCEDYEFWRRLAVECQFRYVDEPLRQHAGNTSNGHKFTEGEITVQRRIMEMREFQSLTGRERARVLCSHGAKNAMLGRSNVARRCFLQAVRNSPTYPSGYVLSAISLFGSRVLQRAIVARRHLMQMTNGAYATGRSND
jgi:glycosyltransferase involved in cell wall biosynthesis